MMCVSLVRHKVSLWNSAKMLSYLMFLKQKCNGVIKGCGCADGWKQCLQTTKEELTSPTIATESVLLTDIIKAKETCHVIITDIPSEFMQGDQDIHLEGVLMELFVKSDPTLYRSSLTEENRQTVLYVELIKALYGTLDASLILW